MITSSEVVGTKPTLNDLRGILSRYSFVSVLVMCGKINTVMQTWMNSPSFDVDRELCKLIFGQINTRIEELRTLRDNRIVFNRLSLLFVCKQAGVVSGPLGQEISTPRALAEIGLCCLMANDLLVPTFVKRSSTLAEKAVSFIPFSSYVSHETFLKDIARIHIILTETVNKKSITEDKSFLDLPSRFHNRMGMSFQVFAGFAFALAVRYLNFSLDDLKQNPNQYFVDPAYFSKTLADKNTSAGFLEQISIGADSLQALLRNQTPRPLDEMTVFQRYPVVRMPDSSTFCLDPVCLVDKCSIGLYWILMDQVMQSEVEKDKLPVFWGRLFEEYVNDLFEETYQRVDAALVRNPTFSDTGTEVADTCIVENENLILVEHKSSVIKSDVKHGGDAVALEDEIKTKLVGTHEKRKGILQLAHSIEKICTGAEIRELGRFVPSRIFPVLITQDPAFSTPYMNAFLNTFFPKRTLRKRCRKTITPVFLLTVTELEDMSYYFGSCRMHEMLQDYYQGSKSLFLPFAHSPHPLLAGASRQKNSPVERKFDEFIYRMTESFFGLAEANQLLRGVRKSHSDSGKMRGNF